MGDSLRLEIVEALGARCVRCGYNQDPRVLHIDHVLDDGAAERKMCKEKNINRYWWIAENIRSGRYQVLCANCNLLKQYNKGKFIGISGKKECQECRKILPVEDFYTNHENEVDGRDIYCTICRDRYHPDKLTEILTQRGSDEKDLNGSDSSEAMSEMSEDIFWWRHQIIFRTEQEQERWTPSAL